MTDLDSLWSYIHDHPKEDAAKLGLADYYTENGNEQMAFTLRWCVKRKRWPKLIKSYDKDVYHFAAHGPCDGFTYKSMGNSIPRPLFKVLIQLAGYLSLSGYTERQAIESLSEGFTRLKKYMEA